MVSAHGICRILQIDEETKPKMRHERKGQAKTAYRTPPWREKELIRQIQAGNREPLGDLIAHYYDEILRFCVWQIRDTADALDTGMNFLFDEEERVLVNSLPFHPLKNPEQMKELADLDDGMQFSHTLEEQIGGQLQAGLILTELMEDTNGTGNLHEHGIPAFLATRGKRADCLVMSCGGCFCRKERWMSRPEEAADIQAGRRRCPGRKG